ncbi:MAG: DctP family TRAP transporter solute-binding subunit [Pseudomonadota bacterium]
MKLRTTLIFLLALAVSGFSHAEGEIVIKFSHVDAPGTPKGHAAERFKQLAEQGSNGRIRVEIYPDSQLYNDREEIEALQSGAVQMLAPSLSAFGAMGLHAFDLFDLPYIFPSEEILHRVTDGRIGKSLFRKLSAKGLTGLAYWDNGFKQMSSNKAMHKVADLKGLKIRIQPSKVLESQIKALGANPQEMPDNEVYTALQQGLLDGAENPLSSFNKQKLFEVQKHLTISNHGYVGYAVIVNKKFWDDLPDDIREVLTLAMNEATGFERDLAQRENDNALANVTANPATEVYVLSDRERIAWQRALLPVYQEFDSVIGNYLIRSVAATASLVKKEKDAAMQKKKSGTK